MSKELKVAYHTQRNNILYPYATCNATSVATVMDFLGVYPRNFDPKQQLDDYVTQQLNTPEAWSIHERTLADWQKYFPRNNHYVLQWFLEKVIPCKDRLIVISLADHFGEIKSSIDSGMPVICGGNYQYKTPGGAITSIGHINVIVGYDESNFIFCDPFGDARTMYTSTEGNHVKYSEDFCRKALVVAHILSK